VESPLPTVVIARRKNNSSVLTVSLHDTQKLDDDLGGGADQDLALAPPFSINDVVLLPGGLLTLRGVSELEMDERGSHSARVCIRSG